MRNLRNGTSATLTRAGVSAVLALAAVGGASTASFAAGGTTTGGQTTMALSSNTGNGATTSTNTVTATLPSTATLKFASGAVSVQFQSIPVTGAATATCSTNPSAATTSVTATVRWLSTTKIFVSVDNLGGVAGQTGYWLACAYNLPASANNSTGVIPSTATVIAKANYQIAAAPTLAGSNVVIPATGPTSGGQVVTISGTNFPTSITAATPLSATFAGVPLTNITPVSSSKFTAVTPVKPTTTNIPVLQVTTAGGTISSTSTVYTYKDGITVSPNTVSQGQSVDVDVIGAGFTQLSFDATSTAANIATATGVKVAGRTNSNKAHVYLVMSAQGALPTYANATFPVADKTNPQQSECVDPVVISDNELICTVDTAKLISDTGGDYQYVTGPLQTGTYHLVVVDKGGSTPTFQTALSSGSVFTVADF